jgi:ABC-type transporter Mla subunit MlaD
MNKQLRQYFKVGVTLVVSLALLFFGISYLSGRLNSDRTIKVVFDDAQGISPGEIVQMAGKEVGQVDDVELTPDFKAQVTVGIHRRYHIPKGSRFQIRSGLLGNTRRLMVIPNTQPGAGDIPAGETVVGDSSSPFDETLTESKKLMIQGQQLVATLQKTVGDPERQRAIDRTIKNTEKITDDLKQVTAQLPEMKMQLDLLIADLRSTLGSTKHIASGAEGLRPPADCPGARGGQRRPQTGPQPGRDRDGEPFHHQILTPERGRGRFRGGRTDRSGSDHTDRQ